MKICENCGMEYGDDNAFCPFCDVRYGVVILADDVISAVGLPAYKEEFPVIGETGVKQENFAANQDEIFERNMRLVKSGDFLLETKSEFIHEPAVPIFKFDRNGDMIPYTPPIAPKPIVQKPVSKPKKTLNKVLKWRLIGFVSVLLLLTVIIGISWIETTDYYEDIQNAENVVTEQTIYDVETRSVSMPEDVIITGKSGLEMKLKNGTEWEAIPKNKNGDTIGSVIIEYEFEYEFTNTTGQDIARFWDDFTDNGILALHIYRIGDGNVNYRSVNLRIARVDGVMQAERNCTVHADETATGVVYIEYNDHFNLNLTKD